MPACHAGGRRVEPDLGRHFFELNNMVGIVKRLRPRVVAPVFVGSNPTTHPIFLFIGVSPSGKATDSDSVIRRFESCYPSQYSAGQHSPAPWRHSQVVRQRSAKPLSPGSNPGVASTREDLFQVSRSFFILLRLLADSSQFNTVLSQQ